MCEGTDRHAWRRSRWDQAVTGRFSTPRIATLCTHDGYFRELIAAWRAAPSDDMLSARNDSRHHVCRLS